jgi:hypothetical protein
VSSSDARVVVALNEPVVGYQQGFRVALDRMVADGRLDTSAVYPFLARIKEGASRGDVVRELTDVIRACDANVLLWAHTSSLGLSDADIAGVRGVLGGGVVGYWEGDWYLGFRKPLPRQALRLMQSSDVVFVCGDGAFTKHLHRAGVTNLRYVPLTTDHRFAPAPPSPEFDCDVAMVANRVRSRVPFKSLPGTHMREQLVHMFEQRLGSRFRVYGRGWEGPSASGPIDFTQQRDVYSSARVVLGTNNCFAKYYFSDRLPIAMSCGRPVLHYRDEGFGEVFGDDSGVFWFKNAEEAWAAFEQASADDASTASRALAGRHLAERLLTTERALEYMLGVLSHVNERRGVEVRNPWIRGEITGE